MILLMFIVAGGYLVLDAPDRALVVAVLAVAWAVQQHGRRGWIGRLLGWDEAIERAVEQREIDRQRRD